MRTFHLCWLVAASSPFPLLSFATTHYLLTTHCRQAVTAAGGPTGSVAQSPCVAIKTSENHTTPGAVDSGCYPNANYLFATLPAPTTDASK